MITLQQGTIYLGTAAPASGGGGSGDAVWGSITGTLSNQTDLATALAAKQDTLTAGTGISISDNVISATGGATSVENKNTADGATNPLNLWEGTSAEYETGGGSQTWYNWQSGGGLSFNSASGAFSEPGVIAYGNGKFINAYTFYQNQNEVAISADNGATWSLLSFDITSYYRYGLTTGSIAYGNGTWVVGFYNNYSRYFGYSTNDGTSWVLATLPSSFTGSAWNITEFGNNIFIMVDQYTGETAYSSDGQSWAQGGTIPGSSPNWTKACFCGDRFVAISSNSNEGAYTSDGLTWTAITLPASKNWVGIAYGNNTLAIVCDTDTDNVYYTDDFGSNWNVATAPVKPSAFAFGGGNFLIARNTDGCYSSDLVNWTSTTLPSSTAVCYYGNSNFVGRGANSGAIYSAGGQSSEVFTTDSAPTTSSQVYSAPNTTSALTITSVGTGTITLSDTNTYNYNASGNQTTSQSVGEAHPDWICLIEGIGIKKGNTTIASIAPTVDQTYNASSTNAQSGVAVAGGIADTLGTINTQLESIIAQGD